MPESSERIAIGSDHAGLEMKEHIKGELDRRGIAWVDMGTNTTESTDYPVYAGRVARAVAGGRHPRGITICGTGIGASIAANRFRGARAALCTSEEMARLSRRHNDANILVLGGRITPFEVASRILGTWLETDFEGGRHKRRVDQLDQVATAEL